MSKLDLLRSMLENSSSLGVQNERTGYLYNKRQVKYMTFPLIPHKHGMGRMTLFPPFPFELKQTNNELVFSIITKNNFALDVPSTDEVITYKYHGQWNQTFEFEEIGMTDGFHIYHIKSGKGHREVKCLRANKKSFYLDECTDPETKEDLGDRWMWIPEKFSEFVNLNKSEMMKEHTKSENNLSSSMEP